MTKNQVPAQAGSTAVVNYEEELRALAIQTAQTEKPQSNWFSFKNGVLAYNGQPAKDNKLEVVILDFLFENAFYEGRYNPNEPASPVCFAISRVDEELAPHEKSEKPQNERCHGCPNNAWGSDPEGGRGKACKNSRRLVCIAANDLVDAGRIGKAEAAMARMPVTSVANWSTYANQISNALKTPTLGVVTEISVGPHPKNQFQVNFRLVRKIEEPEFLRALLRKRAAVADLLFQPYEKNQPKAAAQPRKFDK